MLELSKKYAHRGGSGFYVENTLAAFEYAINLGCSGAELDVHLTKDKQVVVHHNAKLNHLYTRKLDGNWLKQSEERPISELTLSELKQYEIGVPNPHTDYHKKFPKIIPAGFQAIPTLQEVIQLVKQKSDEFRLLIEIKTDILANSHFAWMPLVEAVLNLVSREGFTERAEYCSFDWRSLIEIKTRQPRVKTWFTTHPLDWLIGIEEHDLSLSCRTQRLRQLRKAFASGKAPWFAGYQPTTLDEFPEMVRRAGGDVWFGYWAGFSGATIDLARQQGIEVAGWTNNLDNRNDYQAINSLNLDAHCIDYPFDEFIETKN